MAPSTQGPSVEVATLKKMLVLTAIVAGLLALLRRSGPALRDRAVRKCGEMMDRMPDDFPPKGMMRGVDDIHEQNNDILPHLHGQREAIVA